MTETWFFGLQSQWTVTWFLFCFFQCRTNCISHPNMRKSKNKRFKWTTSNMYLNTASTTEIYFFLSFSASAAFFIRTPTNCLFILSTRNLAYALKFFISSATLIISTDGFASVIGMNVPWTWVAVDNFSGLESPLCL